MGKTVEAAESNLNYPRGRSIVFAPVNNF